MKERGCSMWQSTLTLDTNHFLPFFYFMVMGVFWKTMHVLFLASKTAAKYKPKEIIYISKMLQKETRKISWLPSANMQESLVMRVTKESCLMFVEICDTVSVRVN